MRLVLGLGLVLASIFEVASAVASDAQPLPRTHCGEVGTPSGDIVARLYEQGWKDADAVTRFSTMTSEEWVNLLSSFFWVHGPEDAKRSLSLLKTYEGREGEFYGKLYHGLDPTILVSNTSDSVVIAGATKPSGDGSFFYDVCFELFRRNEDMTTLTDTAVAEARFGAAATPASHAYTLTFDRDAARRTSITFVSFLTDQFKDFGSDAPQYPVQVRRITEVTVSKEVQP